RPHGCSSPSATVSTLRLAAAIEGPSGTALLHAASMSATTALRAAFRRNRRKKRLGMAGTPSGKHANQPAGAGQVKVVTFKTFQTPTRLHQKPSRQRAGACRNFPESAALARLTFRPGFLAPPALVFRTGRRLPAGLPLVPGATPTHLLPGAGADRRHGRDIAPRHGRPQRVLRRRRIATAHINLMHARGLFQRPCLTDQPGGGVVAISLRLLDLRLRLGLLDLRLRLGLLDLRL